MAIFDCLSSKKQAASSLVAAAKKQKKKPVGAVWNIGPVINGKDYSQGMPKVMPQDGQGYYFDFPPSPGGVDYIFRSSGAVKAGQTMSIAFSLSGTGLVKPCANSGTGPARLRLYFQRKGDDWSGSRQFEFYRWWSTANVVLDALGDFTLSAVLDPAQWSSVLGRTGDAAPKAFADALAKANVVGFTFGASFAGHGDYADGPVRFRLNSFAIV